MDEFCLSVSSALNSSAAPWLTALQKLRVQGSRFKVRRWSSDVECSMLDVHSALPFAFVSCSACFEPAAFLGTALAVR